MESGPLAELLVERFETMPPQLQAAARYVLDHPKDVALMSMREQAHHAGVSHSTMMRLARWLGLDGYEDMRALYAEALRNSGTATAGHAAQREGEGGGVSEVGSATDMLAAQVASLGEYGSALELMAAADVLAAARHLLALGLRAEHAVAHHFVRLLSAFGDRASLLDGAGCTGPEALCKAGPDDAVLAIGLAPYARATIETARLASERGLAVVAITDSRVSPLARLARESVIVTTRSQSALPSLVPALAAVEVLAGLVVHRSGVDVEAALKAAEEQLASLDIFWRPPR